MFLFLLNIFSLKNSALSVIGPGWEIPVDSVAPLKLTGRLAFISTAVYIGGLLCKYLQYPMILL